MIFLILHARVGLKRCAGQDRGVKRIIQAQRLEFGRLCESEIELLGHNVSSSGICIDTEWYDAYPGGPSLYLEISGI